MLVLRASPNAGITANRDLISDPPRAPAVTSDKLLPSPLWAAPPPRTDVVSVSPGFQYTGVHTGERRRPRPLPATRERRWGAAAAAAPPRRSSRPSGTACGSSRLGPGQSHPRRKKRSASGAAASDPGPRLQAEPSSSPGSVAPATGETCSAAAGSGRQLRTGGAGQGVPAPALPSRGTRILGPGTRRGAAGSLAPPALPAPARTAGPRAPLRFAGEWTRPSGGGHPRPGAGGQRLGGASRGCDPRAAPVPAAADGGSGERREGGRKGKQEPNSPAPRSGFNNSFRASMPDTSPKSAAPSPPRHSAGSRCFRPQRSPEGTGGSARSKGPLARASLAGPQASRVAQSRLCFSSREKK